MIKRTVTYYILYSKALHKYIRKAAVEEDSCKFINGDHNLLFALSRVSKLKKAKRFVEITKLDEKRLSTCFDEALMNADINTISYERLDEIFSRCYSESLIKCMVWYLLIPIYTLYGYNIILLLASRGELSSSDLAGLHLPALKVPHGLPHECMVHFL